MQQEMEIKKDSSSKYLVFGLVLSGLIFVMDAQIPLGIADGMLYVVLVLLGLMARNRSFIIYAASISTGQTAKCNDAKSITLETAGPANATGGKFGYSTNDRGGANVVIWKSSNFTTIPITLGPNDNNNSLNGTDGGRTGLPQRGGMGKHKVTLVSQNNFSRGDSIGDISGLVKITNTGAIPVTVICN